MGIDFIQRPGAPQPHVPLTALTKGRFGLAGRIEGDRFPRGQTSLVPRKIRGMLDVNRLYLPAVRATLTGPDGVPVVQYFPFHEGVTTGRQLVDNFAPDRVVELGRDPERAGPGLLLRLRWATATLDALNAAVGRGVVLGPEAAQLCRHELDRIESASRLLLEVARRGGRAEQEQEDQQPPVVPADYLTHLVEQQSWGEQPAGLRPWLPRHEFTLATPAMEGVGAKPALPGAAALAPAALAHRVQVLVDNFRQARTTLFTKELAELQLDLAVYQVCVQTLADVATWAAQEDLKRPAFQERLGATAARLQAVFDEALRQVLAASHDTERAVRSLYAFFTEANADGSADGVFHINVNPVTTKRSLERGEISLVDLDPTQYPCGEHPLFDTAVEEDGVTPLLVTFVSLAQKRIFQTAASALALAATLGNGRDARFFSARASNGSFAVLADADPADFADWNPRESPARLRGIYGSEDESYKSLVVAGNPPVGRAPSRWDAEPVLVFASCVLLGKLYANARTKPDTSLTTPATSPERDKLDRDIYQGLHRPRLALDRGEELSGLPIVFLTACSNRRADGTVTVFNGSQSAWTGGEHTLELELGNALARRLVAHTLLQNVGKPSTNSQAQAVGRQLNALLLSLSGNTSRAIFEHAYCEWRASKCVAQVLRDADGEVVVDPQSSEPVLTGRTVQQHRIYVKLQQGVSSFEVHIAG